MTGASQFRSVQVIFLLLTIGVSTFSFADEAGAKKAFAAAKRTAPELFLFLKGMPKGGDLHVHVSGAAYSDYMLDAAVAKGLYFDPETSQFGNDSSKIPASKLLSDNKLLDQFLNAASMRGWSSDGGVVDGQTGHDHFFETFGRFRSAYSAEDPADALLEVISRAQSQNEEYMELMLGVTPGVATSAYMANVPSSTDMKAALELLRPKLVKLLATAKPFLDAREQLGRRLGQSSLTDVDQPMTVRYIWSCNRLDSNDQFFAEAAAGIYLAAHEPRIVALNMVAPEDHPLARKNFDAQMHMIDFLWRELGKPNLTLHAGELTPEISPVEPMRDRIRKTIDLGHAKRIGHGVSIAWEDDSEGLMERMRKEGIAVEICLTSNRTILRVAGENHPLRLYRAHGVPVFLNTDDEGVSRTTLTLEWVKAVREQGMGYEDLKEMARNSIEFSFLPGVSLYETHNFQSLRAGFEHCRLPKWKPSKETAEQLKKSEKMRMELKLERAFQVFEAKFH